MPQHSIIEVRTGNINLKFVVFSIISLYKEYEQ